MPRPADKRIVESTWVCRVKSDGPFKAGYVARGFQQQCDNENYAIYATVAKLCTFRVMLAVANKLRLVLYQMDIQGAFLYGEISDEVYISLPGEKQSNNMCKLNKSIHGLKKSSKCWNL